MKKAGFLMLSALLVGSFGCEHVVVLKANSMKGGQGGEVQPVLYEDFEKGLVSSYGFGNTAAGGGAKIAEETGEKHGGAKCARIDYQTGNGNWGCGFGFGSSYAPAAGSFNAKGTKGLELWAKANVGLNFNFMVQEGKNNGGDDEVWVSSDVTGTGRWKRYFIGWDQFTRSIYSGNQSGDDTMETASLASMQGQLREKQGDGKLYIDDVYFK